MFLFNLLSGKYIRRKENPLRKFSHGFTSLVKKRSHL
jgi:hypothetical protein